MFDHSDLPSGRALLGPVSQNLPLSLMFSLSNFPPVDPQPAPCLQVLTVSCCIEPSFSFHHKIAAVSTLTVMFLNKESALLFFNKYQQIIFS